MLVPLTVSPRPRRTRRSLRRRRRYFSHIGQKINKKNHFCRNLAETESEANVACGGDAATQLTVLSSHPKIVRDYHIYS